MGCGCRVEWRRMREGELLGVSFGLLVAKVEKVGEGRYRLTRVERVSGERKVKISFASSLRAVHAFKRGVEMEHEL